ncbi:MAG TPA: glycosyltransferase family 4 protein [Patescibacteria group bacterium]
MKILLISHIFPPAVDGGSRVVWQLGQYFQAQGHDILALSSDCRSTDDFVNPKSSSLKLSTQPIQVIRLPVHKNFCRPLKAVSLILPKNSLFRDFLNVLQKGPLFKLLPFIVALKKIKDFQPDLIVAGPLPTTIILYALFIKKFTHTKLVINASFHRTDPDFSKKPLINALNQADLIWSLTRSEKIYFRKKLKIITQIKVLGNGVSPELLSIAPVKAPEDPVLLYIGSFAAHKRIEVLVQAFAKLSPDFPKLRLVLAGQKTLYYPNIEKFINGLSWEIKKKIIIVANFSDSQLPELIDGSSILIQPSVQESFGLVIIESMFRKRPVIAADIPSSSEIIKNSQGGLTFSADNSDNLADNIKSLLNDSALSHKLASSGFDYVNAHYTWDRIGEEILKCF